MTMIDCPFCGTNLMYDENDLMCPNPYCEKTDGCFGNGEIWELLVKTKKKLDIAVDALKTVRRYTAINQFAPKSREAHIVAKKAVAEITALEQKDKR